MITPALSNAPTSAATVSHEPHSSQLASMGPYALPSSTVVGMALDAVMIDAIRTASGPFVPAPWRDQQARRELQEAVSAVETPVETARSAPVAVMDVPVETAGSENSYEEQVMVEDELPWIDAFADIPEMGTVSQVTREEQGEQESSFVDETLFPSYDAAEVAYAETPSVAETLSFLTPLPDDVEGAVEPVSAEPSSDPMSWHGSEAAPALPSDPEPSFESAWESAEPIEEDGRREESVLAAQTLDVTQEQVPAIAEGSLESAIDNTAGDQATQEDWPLAEAAESLRMLADEMPSVASESVSRHDVGRPYATPLGVPPVAMTPPLPMWDDEDGMDLMPVKLDPSAAHDSGHWSRVDGQTSNGVTESGAALAIEAIAQRIRRGELAVPGYSDGMSEAATLAAALTALLSAAA